MAKVKFASSRLGIEVAEGAKHPLVKHWIKRHGAKQETVETRPVDYWDQHGMPVEQDEHFDVLESRQANTRKKNVLRVAPDSPTYDAANTEQRMISRYVLNKRWQSKLEPELAKLGYPV